MGKDRWHWLRNTNLKKFSFLHRIGLQKKPFSMSCDFRADGVGTKNKSLKFLEDWKFQRAWNRATLYRKEATGEGAPDIRWRTSICIWAAQHALKLEGDFVECGVFTGLFSIAICDYLEFQKVNKNFWLFDTWAGIPTKDIEERERKTADRYNKDYHERDVWDVVKGAFSPYKNCHLIRGMLPGTLQHASIDKIAYLSIDLNNSTYEKACIEALWDRLVLGAIVVIDDYNFKVCRPQQDMWDKFAESKNTMIAALPTGQGLLIKA